MLAGASVHVFMCVNDDCCECVCGVLRHRDPVAGTVKDPTLIDSKSKLKRCLYLGKVGGDCRRRRRRSTPTQQAGILSHTHSAQFDWVNALRQLIFRQSFFCMDTLWWIFMMHFKEITFSAVVL